MVGVIQEVAAGAVLPRVQNPWPESIGLGFPFALAGASGVLMGVLLSEAPSAKRDRAIRIGGLWGFRIGALFYSACVVVQVLSG